MSQAAGHAGSSVGLYAAAFAFMLVGAALLVVASLGSLQSTGLLWWSAGASYVAVVLSILSLVLPARRR